MSLDQVKNVILVLSGKGGVGKSSVTTQLALSLSLSGHSVGILDIDLTGPSVPRFLGIEDAKVTQAPGGWLPVRVHAAQDLPPLEKRHLNVPNGASQAAVEHASNEVANPADTSTGDNRTLEDKSSNTKQHVGPLSAMSIAFLLASRSSAIVWRGPKKTAMVRQFLSDVLWGQLDYLIIDTPPGTSDEHISVVESLLTMTIPASEESSTQLNNPEMNSRPRLAGAVVVTTPQAVAVADVRKELNFCATTKLRVLGVVENMSGYVCPCCGEPANIFSKGGGQVMATEFGVPFLGSVPIDPQWGTLVEDGLRPVYRNHPERVPNGADKHDELEDDRSEEAEDSTNEDSEDESQKEERRRGPLVEKYRNCSLYPLFQDIAQKVTSSTHFPPRVEARES